MVGCFFFGLFTQKNKTCLSAKLMLQLVLRLGEKLCIVFLGCWIFFFKILFCFFIKCCRKSGAVRTQRHRLSVVAVITATAAAVIIVVYVVVIVIVVVLLMVELFSRFCICWGGITIVIDSSCVILWIGTFEPCD